MPENLLTLKDVSRIYRRSTGAIRQAVWRANRHGTNPGLPLPIRVAGKFRWVKAEVAAHIEQLRLAAAASAGDSSKTKGSDLP